MDKLIDVHEQIVTEIDKISEMLVRAGADSPNTSSTLRNPRKARKAKSRRPSENRGGDAHLPLSDSVPSVLSTLPAVIFSVLRASRSR